MANLTSILGTALISNAPSTLNGNFNALNVQANATSVIASSTLTGRIITTSTAGASLSLSTVATDQVTVWARGTISGSTSAGSVAVIYNGVTKDALEVKQAAAADQTAFSLMYSETPGAASQTVVVSVIANGNLSINNPRIIIQKIT